MVMFVTLKESFPKENLIVTGLLKHFPQITSVFQNVNPVRTNVILGKRSKRIFGRDHIVERLGDLRFRISPTSFFQINTRQAEVLYALIKEQLPTGLNVIDVYSGTGGIALSLSGISRKVYGIEENRGCAADAIKNAELNGIKNCQFIHGRAEDTLGGLSFLKNCAVVLDPPRAGCTATVLDSVIKLKPSRIIYVSCNPSTLLRDLRYLGKKYRIDNTRSVDMFPQTSHIECVACLERA